MNTPLSFTVTVTSCMSCPYRVSMNCLHEKYLTQFTAVQIEMFLQNKDQLTNSCPMVAKEGEKK